MFSCAGVESTAALVGSGCTKPPLKGKPPSSTGQCKYNLVTERGQFGAGDKSSVDYHLYYKDNVCVGKSNSTSGVTTAANSKGNKQKTLIDPQDPVCVNGYPYWIELTEDSFYNTQTLVSQVALVADLAGRQEIPNYEKDGCFPTGDILKVIESCFGFINPLKRKGKSYQYRVTAGFVCPLGGERDRQLTFSGNMFTEFL